MLEQSNKRKNKNKQNSTTDHLSFPQPEQQIDKQTISMSNLIKMNFFDNQIGFISDLKDEMEDVKTFSKKIILSSNNKLPMLNKLNEQIKIFIQEIQEDIIQTKVESGRGFTETQVQTDAVFRTYEQKIQELNDRLVHSQKLVQEAEQIKRKRSDEYFVSRIKLYKKNIERKNIEKNIKLKKKFIQEMTKSIEIVFKVLEKLDKKQKNDHELSVRKLLRYRQDKIGYRKFKELEDINKKRSYKSQDKHILNKNEIQKDNMSINLGTILISKTYEEHFKEAIKLKTLRIRENNQKLTQKNRIFERALEEKNKIMVLQNLRNESNMSFEEKIMKLQLEAEVFYKNIDEKLLSVKVKKKSKEWPSYEKQQMMEVEEEPKLKRIQSLKSKNNGSQSKTIQSLKQH